MPGDVIQFRAREEHPPEPVSYRRLPPEIIARLFEEMRGANNDDLVLILNTSREEDRVIQCTHLKSGTPEESKERLLGLFDLIYDTAPEASDLDDWAVVFGDDGNNVVYLRGSDSVLGFGYSDAAECPKGMMMAVLVAYCFSIYNMDADEPLAKLAFESLPFLPAVGLSQHFLSYADRLVFETMAEE